MIRVRDIDAQTPQHLASLSKQWRRQEPDIPLTAARSLATSLLRDKFSGRQQLFALCSPSGSQTLAHVVARLSPTVECPSGQPLGMLGFFAAQCPDPVPDLLSHAMDWLKQQGATSVVGPMDGDTWHRYRMNSGPWDQQPFLMEPENPSWYPEAWEAAGFQVIDRYHSKRLVDLPVAINATAPALERARSAGYRFRRLDMQSYEKDLRAIYEISLAAFRDNFLFDEISWEEFQNLYHGARSIVHPGLVWFAVSPEGQPVGFLFNTIDYWQAVTAMHGRQDVLAKFRFWRNRSRATAVNFKSIGIRPRHRRQSLAGALMHLGYQATSDLGYQRANLCLIRDGNVSSGLDGGVSQILRRYVLYQSPGSHFPLS
ncbi:MAG: GNAT family N-acetyltransferase [Pirellulaceae bacterium]